MTDFVLILGVYVLTLVAGALIATGVWMLRWSNTRLGLVDQEVLWSKWLAVLGDPCAGVGVDCMTVAAMNELVFDLSTDIRHGVPKRVA